MVVDAVSKGCNLVAMLTSKRSKKQAQTNPEIDRNPESRVKKELEFLLTINASATVDILAWWKMREKEFPLLAVTAKKIFCSCATSVTSERIFSLSGHIVSKKRSLRTDMVNMLTCLAFNSE
jgi:hypothetical protein